jgi:glycosyltransferase involved in cell wall biosynthesis
MAEREPPRVSVVVPTRDRADRLGRLLASLRAQTLDRFEVIVVDDGSRDATPDVLAEQRLAGGLELEVVRREQAAGPATARNAGWRRARSPLVAFIDDDCEATATWLEEGVRAAAAAPGAIVQGPATPAPSESALIGPFTRTLDRPGPGPWFQTANIFYPRELLERLGGFDERFPDALGEDTDLGWRALEAGAAHAFAPAARVHHAVHVLGPLGSLRAALRGPDAVYVFRRHPGLRRSALRWGVFRNPALLRMAFALAGLALARRVPPAALLALPYARSVLGRAIGHGAPALAGYYLAYDLLALYTSLRGSVRHRTLVI